VVGVDGNMHRVQSERKGKSTMTKKFGKRRRKLPQPNVQDKKKKKKKKGRTTNTNTNQPPFLSHKYTNYTDY